MSTEMTQVDGAAASQQPGATPVNPAPAAQPAAEQPKDGAQPAAPAAPAAPEVPAPAAETPWLESETLGLSNRTWCEIIGAVAVAGVTYFVTRACTSGTDAGADPTAV